MKNKARKREMPAKDGLLTLCYRLAELPSAQHRAGLAGLVLMVKYLNRKGSAGVLRVDVEEGGAQVELDRTGLRQLFDELYAASLEEQPSSRPWKDRPPKRVEEQEERDEGGKLRTKKCYIYDVVVPRGGLLEDLDPRRGVDSAWMKLWRDMVWNILRGVPTTRAPFKARAEGKQTNDADEAWEQLTHRPEDGVRLPSTYFIGAQESTAENVPFRDRARFQFLLHFWPYVAQVYVPRVLTKPRENRSEFVGYVLSIPDVGQLESFCAVLPDVLRQRDGDRRAGYRPLESVIDLAEEGALDLAHRLQRARAEVQRREGARMTGLLVLGFDVLHMNNEGNSIRLLSASRVDPDPVLIDQYARCREFKDPVFRRQILRNLLDGRPRYAGFDGLVQQYPYDKQLIGSRGFCQDAQRLFDLYRGEVMEQSAGYKNDEADSRLAEIVYQVVKSYVRGKLKSKYDLAWDEEKMEKGSEKEKEFNDKKRKIAVEAFLAVRSRTGRDFVDYFSGTICSTKQYLTQEQFVLLGEALRHETRRDDVRTLTLLALSANS